MALIWTPPPGVLFRPPSRSALYAVRCPIRESVLPPSFELKHNQRETFQQLRTAYSMDTLRAGELQRPSSAPNWREGRVPDWWRRHLEQKRVSPPAPVQLTKELQAQVDGVLSQLRVLLARNLNRTVDTFRTFDLDSSGAIDKREWRLSLLKHVAIQIEPSGRRLPLLPPVLTV
jgi:hypothetical protein